MTPKKSAHRSECQRCGKSFLGRFGQKYCSNSCRSGAWFSKNRSVNRLQPELKNGNMPIEINGLESTCPLCKTGRLYTSGGEPGIIKCSDISVGCKGYWALAPLFSKPQK